MSKHKRRKRSAAIDLEPTVRGLAPLGYWRFDERWPPPTWCSEVRRDAPYRRAARAIVARNDEAIMERR